MDGALQRRIEGGEAFDLAVITPREIEDLVAKAAKAFIDLLSGPAAAAILREKGIAKRASRKGHGEAVLNAGRRRSGPSRRAIGRA